MKSIHVHPHLIHILVLTVFLLMMPACGKKNQDNSKLKQQSAESTGAKSEAPDQLKEFESDIEKIIGLLNGPNVQTTTENKGQDKSSQQESTTSGGGSSPGGSTAQESTTSKSSQGGPEGKQDQQSQKGQGQAQEQTQGQNQGQGQQKDPWESITPVINNMHYKWNSLMPMAAKMGGRKELLDGIGSALNSLTSAVISKDKNHVLMASSYLYGYVPDTYSLYKSGPIPEMKRVRHYIRDATLNAMTGNWKEAEKDMTSLKSSWALLKNILEKDQQQQASTLDFSIYELDKVMLAKDQPLCDIKGRIALSNIQAIEKAMEKASQGGGGGQQGGGSQEGGGGQ